MNEQDDDAGDKKAATLRPFDWTSAGHALVKAGQAVDWDITDLSAFAKRVQSIEYGLTAETEFAAILSWLGRCPLVHGLEQDYFSSQSEHKCQIPDLFAVFDHHGHRVPALVEVKTLNKELLTFKTSYLDGLRRYADEISLPLLIAWKPRRLGFWLLVDPIHAKAKGNKSILTLEMSAQNNLLSAIAGDFVVVPKENAGMFFEAKIVKKTKTTKDGFEAVAKFTDAGFRDANGERATDIPPAILAILFSSMELVDEVTETQIRKSFVTHEHAIYAQQILRTVIAFRANAAKPIKWRHVARDLNAYLSRDELDSAIRMHFGTFVKYQFFQHPIAWPTGFPEIWNALD